MRILQPKRERERLSQQPTGKVLLSLLLIIGQTLCGGWAAEAHAQSLDASAPKLRVRIAAKQNTIRPGQTLVLRAEIFNEGTEAVFVGREIQGPDNALSQLRLNFFKNGKLVDAGGSRRAADYLRYAEDSPSKPPLASEFSKYWVALSPGNFYGGDVVMDPSQYETLRIPGRHLVRGTYMSEGFLHAGMNNPLASYVNELKNMPFQAWTGAVDTNSVWIDVVKPSKK